MLQYAVTFIVERTMTLDLPLLLIRCAVISVYYPSDLDFTVSPVSKHAPSVRTSLQWSTHVHTQTHTHTHTHALTGLPLALLVR